MGLASKMAAANQAGGAPSASSAPPSQQSQYGAPPSAPPAQQPGQQQYGQAPPSQYGQAPTSQYGAPPGQSYGAPPPVPSGQRPGAPPAGSQSQYGAPPGAPPGHPSATPGQHGAPPAQGGPGQSQYGAPPQSQSGQPSQQQYGQPPQQQYGQPPQQQQYGQAPPAQGQYGGAPPAQNVPAGARLDPRQVETVLQQCVMEQKIQAFYPPGSLSQLAQRVAESGAIDKISTNWRMPKELAMDLLKLSLFDTVILVDDSGSMAFEEGGERIDDLKLILSRVAYAASLFDQDGIQVRFLNSPLQGNNISTEQAALDLVSQVKFSGLTPLGTAMDQKILQPLVLGPARQNSLQKPVLVIAITDGTPAGEARDHIFRVLVNANGELQRTRYGPDAVSYQFAQVGNDLKAQAFLGEIDSHPQVGGMVDCTSNYESEADEMKRKSGMELTPELWLVKLLMGGIDDSYDEQDEQR